MSNYRIAYTSCGRAIELHTRKQFPAARHVLSDLVHMMLRGHGLLDRPIAYKLMAVASRITRDVHSADIKLDEFSTVTIERIG